MGKGSIDGYGMMFDTWGGGGWQESLGYKG